MRGKPSEKPENRRNSAFLLRMVKRAGQAGGQSDRLLGTTSCGSFAAARGSTLVAAPAAPFAAGAIPSTVATSVFGWCCVRPLRRSPGLCSSELWASGALTLEGVRGRLPPPRRLRVVYALVGGGPAGIRGFPAAAAAGPGLPRRCAPRSDGLARRGNPRGVTFRWRPIAVLPRNRAAARRSCARARRPRRGRLTTG